MQNTTTTQTGDANGSSYSGRLDTTLEDFARTLNREGYVITETSGDYALGYRNLTDVISHDDFRWAANRFETGAGGSMAAYLENGEAFDGPWFFQGAKPYPSVHYRWYTDRLAFGDQCSHCDSRATAAGRAYTEPRPATNRARSTGPACQRHADHRLEGWQG